jgi:hypothetical protein
MTEEDISRAVIWVHIHLSVNISVENLYFPLNLENISAVEPR